MLATTLAKCEAGLTLGDSARIGGGLGGPGLIVGISNLNISKVGVAQWEEVQCLL